jgi:hypothetical protein
MATETYTIYRMSNARAGSEEEYRKRLEEEKKEGVWKITRT